MLPIGYVMDKYEKLYLSNNQWEKLQNPGARNKPIPPTKKLLSGIRIKKSLEAIKLSQQRLVELPRFKVLLEKHGLKQSSYSREMISKLINKTDNVSDKDFIEWIKIFLSFFYTDRCILISREEIPEKDPEFFIVWLQEYCRKWESRKDTMKNTSRQLEPYNWKRSMVSRKEVIVGRWEGDAVQEFSDSKKIPAKVKGELAIHQNDIIRGKLRYTYEVNEEKIINSIIVYGRFLFESFLRLNYENKEDFVKQFGAAILQLDPTGTYLEGKFIGFGSKSKKIIQADILLKKVNVDG
jgi:hypothetical protein